MFSACKGSTSAFSVEATFHPTMRREYASVTNATYANPAHVRTHVTSETHGAADALVESRI